MSALSGSWRINSIVSSILAIEHIDGSGINVAGSSAAVGPVDEGLRIMMGFEVFFWRIWYVFVPALRRAYAGAAVVGEEAVMVSLEGYQEEIPTRSRESGVTHVVEFSDSRRARSSGGSSISLKDCWWWLAVKGISVEYWDGMILYFQISCKVDTDDRNEISDKRDGDVCRRHALPITEGSPF